MSAEYSNPVCKGAWQLGTACGICERCAANKPAPGNVTRLRHALPLGQDINTAVSALDKSIAEAVDAAKNAGLPQGLIVGLLHGHAHAQTHQMVTE